MFILSPRRGIFVEPHEDVGFQGVMVYSLYICCLELWMELGATLPGAGVRDLFPEGIEVVKSWRRSGSGSARASKIDILREISKNRKFSNHDLSALELGYRCGGVQ